jgi:hypothetical protein
VRSTKTELLVGQDDEDFWSVPSAAIPYSVVESLLTMVESTGSTLRVKQVGTYFTQVSLAFAVLLHSWVSFSVPYQRRLHRQVPHRALDPCIHGGPSNADTGVNI